MTTNKQGSQGIAGRNEMARERTRKLAGGQMLWAPQNGHVLIPGICDYDSFLLFFCFNFIDFCPHLYYFLCSDCFGLISVWFLKMEVYTDLKHSFLYYRFASQHCPGYASLFDVLYFLLSFSSFYF